MGFKRDCNILSLFLIYIPQVPVNLAYGSLAFSVFFFPSRRDHVTLQIQSETSMCPTRLGTRYNAEFSIQLLLLQFVVSAH